MVADWGGDDGAEHHGWGDGAAGDVDGETEADGGSGAGGAGSVGCGAVEVRVGVPAILEFADFEKPEALNINPKDLALLDLAEYDAR